MPHALQIAIALARIAFNPIAVEATTPMSKSASTGLRVDHELSAIPVSTDADSFARDALDMR